MTGEELRAFLEAYWAANRGRMQDEMLLDYACPTGEPDGIEWVGAERVAERLERWLEVGNDPDEDSGALWMDGFITGLAVAKAMAS